jgi:hypothetical protein
MTAYLPMDARRRFVLPVSEMGASGLSPAFTYLASVRDMITVVMRWTPLGGCFTME